MTLSHFVTLIEVTNTHFVTFISSEKKIFSLLSPCRHPHVRSVVSPLKAKSYSTARITFERISSVKVSAVGLETHKSH